MGILDSKTRIIDTLVTFEGRRQIASGRLKVEWVTLSDTATFYEADLVSGSSDATSRLYLEVCNLPQDEITFRSDTAGKLLPFRNSNGITTLSGKIFTGSLSVSASYAEASQDIPDEQFVAAAVTLISSSLDNFKKLQLISTLDFIFEEDQFIANPNSAYFKVTDDNPIANVKEQSANINHMQSFFQDKRMMHIDNFMYLPPITKNLPENINLEDASAVKRFRIGEYSALGPVNKTSYYDFEEELKVAERAGNLKVIRFDPTSHSNKLALQFFEIRKNDILKLDAIDFGTHVTDDVTYPNKKIYFLGKVLVDNSGNYTFIHIFTVVLE